MITKQHRLQTSVIKGREGVRQNKTETYLNSYEANSERTGLEFVWVEYANLDYSLNLTVNLARGC